MSLCETRVKEDARNGLISFGIFFLAGGLTAIALFVLTIGGCAIGLCAEFLTKLALPMFPAGRFALRHCRPLNRQRTQVAKRASLANCPKMATRCSCLS